MWRIKSKRGVSIILGYVLLVSITIALSIIVYSWLHFYVSPSEETKCPDEVNVAIEDYDLLSNIGRISITVKNRGLFDIDGFILRVNDRPDAAIGIYNITNTGVPLNTSTEANLEYTLPANIGQVTFIEIQPFIIEDNVKIFCPAISTQSSY